jgi:alkylation response protein AidB-like acyl-CoA dehydrogenase
MDFSETAEQAMLREAVGKIAADFGYEYFAAKARTGEKTTELWQAVGRAGYLGVSIRRSAARCWPASARRRSANAGCRGWPPAN